MFIAATERAATITDLDFYRWWEGSDQAGRGADNARSPGEVFDEGSVNETNTSGVGLG